MSERGDFAGARPAVEGQGNAAGVARAGLAFIRGICGTWGGLIGLSIVLAIVFLAVFQPMPYDPFQQAIPQRLKPPSAEHWFGTDQLGRDLFSRVVAGSRVAVIISLVTAGIALALGELVGTLAGYFGGLVDRIVVALCDTLQSFPNIALALVVIALMGPSFPILVIVLVVAFAPYYARVARGLVLQIKERPYILAERALGAGSFRIISRHIVPGMVPSMLTMVTMDIPTIITAEAGLSFLGLGIRPPNPSWGGIMYEGFGRITSWPWGVIAASIAIVSITLGFTLLGGRLKQMLGARDLGEPR